MAARHADGWDAPLGPSAEESAHKVRVLEQACTAIGRDPASIRRSAHVAVVRDQAELQAKFGTYAFDTRPGGVLMGSDREVLEGIRAFERPAPTRSCWPATSPQAANRWTGLRVCCSFPAATPGCLQGDDGTDGDRLGRSTRSTPAAAPGSPAASTCTPTGPGVRVVINRMVASRQGQLTSGPGGPPGPGSAAPARPSRSTHPGPDGRWRAPRWARGRRGHRTRPAPR
jgi:hypothetical protein